MGPYGGILIYSLLFQIKYTICNYTQHTYMLTKNSILAENNDSRYIGNQIAKFTHLNTCN